MNQLSPAESLLKTLKITSASEIDVEKIACDAGATVKYCRLNKCEAHLVGKKGRAIIIVNSGSIKSRQRFSIAHELGHWHYHRGRSMLCRTDDIGNPGKSKNAPERVADKYATNLLMPRYLFKPEADQIGEVSFEAVKILQHKFQVSMTAAAIRLIELETDISFLICHGKGGRKWFCRSPSIHPKWYPHSSLGQDSDAYETLYASKTPTGRKLASAEAWFSHSEADKYEIHEETHVTANGEILTFLTFRDEEMLNE